MTYPVWLEGELEAAQNRVEHFYKKCSNDSEKVMWAKYYIYDLEKGLRIIRKSLDTLKVSDGEVVFQSVSWIERTLEAAKREFDRANGKP